MDKLLFWATDALSASLLVALAAALLWGIFSVLLSPCHLGTIPLVIGVVGSTTSSSPKRGRGALLSFALAGGMLGAIAILGVVVATVGYALQQYRTVTNYVIAAIFVAAGLHLIGVLSIPLPSLTVKGSKRKGVLAVAIVGFVLGLGLSPCTFAFLAPILGVTFGSSATSPLRGIALLLAFGVGHCGVIGLAGSSTEFIQRYLDWNEQSKALTILKIVCGVLVLFAAAGLVYTA
ncbi:MAG TPA: cytochrome c biogenesis protein CcdA [Polyangiaceae bacterium]|nr:cytochrome c biogenesis protein CcdA [Polyangiaceae bacterium]